MELIYYTIAAVVLYSLSDFILNNIEHKMGKRLANRSFYFLIIITILSLSSFSLIRAIFAPLPTATQEVMQEDKKVSAPILKPAPTESPDTTQIKE
ncbi:MAG: hypothetical protein KAT25_08405 [Sulfuriflexus sp.]|nr:hypothetical protein [Sulfuriflexus sp.]